MNGILNRFNILTFLGHQLQLLEDGYITQDEFREAQKVYLKVMS